jgi:hypothetical protein
MIKIKASGGYEDKESLLKVIILRDLCMEEMQKANE